MMNRLLITLGVISLLGTLFSSQAHAAEIQAYPGENGYQVIMITGPIMKGDGDAFYAIARETPKAFVLLTSPGGLVEEGIWIAAEIAARGYHTWVLPGAGCHSICAVMWVSGARRYMDKDSNISVHAAYEMAIMADGSAKYSVSGSANAKIGAFLNELELSFKAIEYFTRAAPGEPLKPITPDIALWLDIDAHIVDGEEIARPKDRPTPRKITDRVVQYSGMAAYCTDVFGVSEEFFRSQARAVLSAGHEVYGGEVFAGLLGEYSDAAKDEIADIGFARWCLDVEKRLRSQSMDTGINGPSFNCAKAETPTEFAICRSEDMWALDRAMNWIFFIYRRNTKSSVSREFLRQQRDWLSRRDECSDNSDCLIRKYQSRLIEFGF
ncbi:hypothetical protein AB2B41_12780 [Marimonas sp. MJW-29]|uniref:Lysozyme inhibitor LprI N-terminal domain-containing protein n=1 Tax=Sulfitobacter sediminis TaxID=3234186 RepID=A0ABV3RND6_9RHOB